MSKIRIHRNTENKESRFFSYLSFGCGLLEIVLFCATLFQKNEHTYSDFDSYEANSNILPPFVWFLILLLIGLITAIISFIRKEPNSFYKKIGLIINGTITARFATIILLIAIS